MCCLKAWQHYLGTHKTKVYTDDIFLQYFEMQPRASTKQLKWHDTLALLDVELIHKLRQDNVVHDSLSRKKEFQLERPLTKTQALRAIFEGESSLEWKIREAYMQNMFTQRYYKNLRK
jgi:hypothetical protein